MISLIIKNRKTNKLSETSQNKMEFLQTLLDEVPIPVFYKDTSGFYLGCNRSFGDFIGLPKERIIGHTVYDVSNKENGDVYYKADHVFLNSKDCQQVYETKLVASNGMVKDVLFQKSKFYNQDGSLGGLIGVIIDLTERKKENAALRESERRLRDLTDLLPQAVFETDVSGRLQYFNKAFSKFFTFHPSEEETRSSIFDFLIEEDRQRAKDNFARKLRGINASAKYWGCKKDGTGFPLVVYANLILGSDGEPTGIRGIIVNMSERIELENRLKHSQNELERVSVFDPLTQLPKRQFFVECLSITLTTAQTAGTRIALINIEPGRIRDLNNTFGRTMGDKVLQIIAKRLENFATSKDLIGRLDGAGFGLVLEKIQTEDEVVKITKNILKKLRKPMVVEGVKLRLNPHAGIALSCLSENNPGQLLEWASMAKIQAKKADDGCIFFNRSLLNGNQKTAIFLESELWDAIEKDQLILHYQPIIDLRTGSATSLEALVRWDHPKMGLIPPADFLPAVERMGLNEKLTVWVLRTAAGQLKHWHSLGHKKIALSINLPPRLFCKEGFSEKLTQILKEIDIKARYFTLEILENELMHEVEKGLITLQTMKDKGFGLALDDFGTGYSSLGHLNKFPLTKLKIDRSFVQKVNSSSQMMTITETIINLGKALNLYLVGEGVETLEQLSFLKCKGVDFAQGFLFCKPQPAPIAENFLKPGYFKYLLEESAKLPEIENDYLQNFINTLSI
ncbi:MAG: EAL domain-containing protein [Pedobacter sp.]